MVWKETGSRLAPGMTPTIIRSDASMNGSFFTAPLRIFDQEYHGTTDGPATAIEFRFLPTANKLINRTVINGLDEVPNQDQWKTDVLPTPFYSVQHVTLDGDGVPFAGFPVLGTWREIPGITPGFGMNRPASGTSRFLTFRVNLAESADLTTILASAVLTLRWTRP